MYTNETPVEIYNYKYQFYEYLHLYFYIYLEKQKQMDRMEKCNRAKNISGKFSVHYMH